MRIARLMLFVSSTCCSFGWVLWCWHDLTVADYAPAGRSIMRQQTPADHAAAILFAIARVTIVMGCAEIVIRDAEKS
jgi:hypothetical protein